MEAITGELGVRYYALIHHDDLRGAPADSVNIKQYPTAATERLVEEVVWRRDPVLRNGVNAEHAFRRSELDDIIQLNRRDRMSFELGARGRLTGWAKRSSRSGSEKRVQDSGRDSSPIRFGYDPQITIPASGF